MRGSSSSARKTTGTLTLYGRLATIAHGPGEQQKTVTDGDEVADSSTRQIHEPQLVVPERIELQHHHWYIILSQHRSTKAEIQLPVLDGNPLDIDPVFLTGDFCEAIQNRIPLD